MGTAFPRPPFVLEPKCSRLRSADLGIRCHTNYLIYTGPDRIHGAGAEPLMADWNGHGPFLGASYDIPGYYPSDIRNAYHDTGEGKGAIAIVDAHDYAPALHDFNYFSRTFDLPEETNGEATDPRNKVFQVVYATGNRPSGNAGWNTEEALDIEWSHSMAPKAKIYLVEANSSSYLDLFTAVIVAQQLPGVTQVSMSWGGGEFYGEQELDQFFANPKVTFFASSGDDAVQEYPAMSPRVVQVGGTSLYTSTVGNYGEEFGWSGSGGGPSGAELRPSYQKHANELPYGWWRGGPDISAVADPYTGVAIYDSVDYYGYVGWYPIGGTSVACPVCAGIANAAGKNRGDGEHEWIYTHPHDYHDVVGGGYYYAATPGWDFVTGFGSPMSMDSL